MRVALVATLSLATLLSTGCAGDPAGTDATLTIKGAGSEVGQSVSPFRTHHVSLQTSVPVLTGDPASIPLTMYALYIGQNADCSNMTLVQDYGAAGAVKDMVAAPTLFVGAPAAGTYACVAFVMSDVVKAVPATTFGACTTGVTYAGDIYRDDSGATWKDVNGNTIVPHGTDTVPVDDHVTIFLSGDTTAALARGIDHGQLLPLATSLVVPGDRKSVV